MKATASCLLTGVLRTTTLAIVIASWITWAALPAVAQNTVPSSATQAAKMPQYASRLSRAGGRPSSSPARQGSRTQPPDLPIYDNGPINGTVDAFFINFGFVVSDTFTVNSSGSITGMSFGAWLYPNDVLEWADISITSSEFGGTTYFHQTVPFSANNCVFNPLGLEVCTETSARFNTPALNSGTYWVNVQNAVVNNGDPVYWDENSGVGCTSEGCPSQASENSIGTIPSESFTMEGDNLGPPTCYHSEGKLQTIANLTPQQAGSTGPWGLAMDAAGNLYGTAINGGSNSAGFAYKLAHFADWLLEPLFTFAGGDTGGQPTNLIVGPNGSLYGGALGGIQNCGYNHGEYCGLVFNLRPKPNPCATAECGWNEQVPYRFTSDADGSDLINVSTSDQQGNLYGTTSSGGTHGAGTVFELTPSGGGWAKTTLYSFGGVFAGGGGPTQVLQGADGNLYGLAGGGIVNGGVVFELIPSGGHWTESVIHQFGIGGDVFNPIYLVQDSSGNLYGIADPRIEEFDQAGLFTLQKSGSGWDYNDLWLDHNCGVNGIRYEDLYNLTIDASGTLYGTGRGGNSGGENCTFGYIFKAKFDGSGWQYNDLWYREAVSFASLGSLALDAAGNLYGTTAGCGTYNAGTVWQLSP